MAVALAGGQRLSFARMNRHHVAAFEGFFHLAKQVLGFFRIRAEWNRLPADYLLVPIGLSNHDAICRIVVGEEWVFLSAR